MKWSLIASLFAFLGPLAADPVYHAKQIEKVKTTEHCLEAFASLVNEPNALLQEIQTWKEQGGDLRVVSWSLYPKLCKAYVPRNPGNFSPENHIDAYAFFTAIKDAKQIPFVEEDHDPHYTFTQVYSESEDDVLNEHNTYYMLEDGHKKALQRLINSLENPITNSMKSPWRIVNVRLLDQQVASKNTSFPEGVKQLIIDERGNYKIQEASHDVRGFHVECTIVPAFVTNRNLVCAGLNALVPILPWKAPYKSQHPTYTFPETQAINVGGGPNWQAPLFINLEEVKSKVNPHSFLHYPNARFPCKNSSIKLVYSSHALEHLNTPTVYRIFAEASRVLMQGGSFVIKVPDYDRCLACWRNKDNSFFGPGWNIESVTPLWPRKGLSDCLDQRASMIFCSFFNNSYGNPFDSSKRGNTKDAYFGPAVIDVPTLRNLISTGTPSEVALKLRNAIKKESSLVDNGQRLYPTIHYCHQSAWSRDELRDLLDVFGFDVVTFDPEKTAVQFVSVPGIREMYNISMYCWAVKR